MRVSQHIFWFTFSNPADIYFPALYAIHPTYITPCCKRTGSIGKQHYVSILSLLGDVGTHMGLIGKQVITSSLPDWRWCWAQLVSRSHYYVIMLGDVGTHMGLIGKQNLLQLHHYRCYVIRPFSPATSSCTSPTHATRCLLPHATHPC